MKVISLLEQDSSNPRKRETSNSYDEQVKDLTANPTTAKFVPFVFHFKSKKGKKSK